MKYRVAGLVTALSLAIAGFTLAASTIQMRDGTTIVGELRKIGSGGSYQVVKTDGSTVIVPAREIISIDGKPLEGGAASPAKPNTGATATTPAPAVGNDAIGQAFKLAKSKADKTETPIVAVQLWDAFIAKYPDSPLAADAKREREAWDKLYQDKAEKIRGKWVGGQELKDLKKKCDDLYKEAVDQTEEMGVRGVSGLAKLDEIIKLYPKHFWANYEKGFYYLVQATRTQQGSANSLDSAIQALETTSRIAPTVPEVWCNLAIGYNFDKQYEKAVQCAWKAVQMRDDKDLVAMLSNAIYFAPRSMKNVNPRIREINADAQILFRKYSIDGPVGWVYLRPTRGATNDEIPDGAGSRPPGVQWTGSGFFVTNDGYIITNHHVAAGAADKPVPDGITFRIRMDDGSELPAELVGIDDKADIAVMRVKSEKPTSFLKIAEDNPEQGAEAMVLGYPATGSDNPSLQVSKGTVKSVHNDEEYHVWFDLNTTHGNSGGPIVDRDGRVIGILTAGGKVYDMMYVFGVGPNQIETFMKVLGVRAPSVVYQKPLTTADGILLDSQRLTRECRAATVYVMAISGAGDTEKTSDAPPGEK
jgi:S1-C subfamily serine protease